MAVFVESSRSGVCPAQDAEWPLLGANASRLPGRSDASAADAKSTPPWRRKGAAVTAASPCPAQGVTSASKEDFHTRVVGADQLQDGNAVMTHVDRYAAVDASEKLLAAIVEGVPQRRKAATEACYRPAGNVYMINMDGYSDTSDTSDHEDAARTSSTSKVKSGICKEVMDTTDFHQPTIEPEEPAGEPSPSGCCHGAVNKADVAAPDGAGALLEAGAPSSRSAASPPQSSSSAQVDFLARVKANAPWRRLRPSAEDTSAGPAKEQESALEQQRKDQCTEEASTPEHDLSSAASEPEAEVSAPEEEEWDRVTLEAEEGDEEDEDWVDDEEEMEEEERNEEDRAESERTEEETTKEEQDQGNSGSEVVEVGNAEAEVLEDSAQPTKGEECEEQVEKPQDTLEREGQDETASHHEDAWSDEDQHRGKEEEVEEAQDMLLVEQKELKPVGTVEGASCSAAECISEPKGTGTPATSTPTPVFDIRSMLSWRCAVPTTESGGVKYDVVDQKLCVPTYVAPREKKPSHPCAEAGALQGLRSRSSLSREGSGSVAAGGGNSPTKLQVSETSWAAQQRARRGASSGDTAKEDQEVARNVKSILNKLTVEKFDELYRKLVGCGIRTPSHIELLIREVFEKAITQHHFIDMYADLCVLVKDHFAGSAISDDPKFGFKRLLLNECQASFERQLKPPADLQQLDAEERILAEVRYKTRMLGNIRFVGALLSRKMLASKVMIGILEELLDDPTPEALESVAALLSVTGSTFDTEEWAYWPVLRDIFKRIRQITQKPTCEPRARCLLLDVLDLRAAGWQQRRPQRMEGPTTLEQVAEKAAAAQEGANPGSHTRAAPATTPTSRQSAPAALAQKNERIAQQPRQQCSATLERSVTPKVVTPVKAEPRFDQGAFRAEVRKIVTELRATCDAEEARLRLAELDVPPASQQPAEICELLSIFAQEGSSQVRVGGFQAVAGLHGKHPGRWQQKALAEGLDIFTEEVCPDLCFDVPGLQRILDKELKPEFMKHLC